MHNASSRQTPTIQSAAIIVVISGQDARMQPSSASRSASSRHNAYQTLRRIASLKPGHSPKARRQKVCVAPSSPGVVLWLASQYDNVELVGKAKAELIGPSPLPISDAATAEANVPPTTFSSQNRDGEKRHHRQVLGTFKVRTPLVPG